MPSENGSEIGSETGSKPEITNTNTQQRINAMANRRVYLVLGLVTIVI